jgi:plasmid stabilization system protein ParE
VAHFPRGKLSLDLTNGSPSSLVAGRRYRTLIVLPATSHETLQRYAASVVKAILNETRMLTRFPRSGRKVPELDKDNIREVFAYSYRIIYSINDEEIIVAAVIHGKRLLQ